ncbi:AraC family transcriptional regulator [Aquimarina agarilytica]|uniref:AraC family transcriptional regulator n=1 Tax=Aquimarina agarilytica TaxID=1087449 RepID=UPI000288D10C|nr:helix-turn-helix domain-containing protein [Aquimarina agarilytica]
MTLILDFILNLGIIVNILILYILGKNERKAYHYKVLFIIFLFILVTQFCFLGYAFKNKMLFFSMFIFQDAIPITIGPLLFLYVKFILLPSHTIWEKNWIHFLLPFLYVLFASFPTLYKMQSNPNVFNHLRTGWENAYAFSIVYSLVYCIFALKILKKGQYLIEEFYSNKDKIDLGWLKKLIYATLLVITVDISITIYELTISDFEGAVFPVAILVVFLIIYLAYHGIMQTEVLIPEFFLKKHGLQKQTEISVVESAVISTKKFEYDREEMIEIQEKLEVEMLNNKWFLDPDLSLGILAEKLSITDKKLSYLLNQHMTASFYTYINQLRVNTAKAKLTDLKLKNYTIIAIAEESGFKAKSTFNTIFKRFTGMTPSQYRKITKNTKV